ncbi:MAG: serine hydrolase domain-containing protein [Bacteroidota bacterium]
MKNIAYSILFLVSTWLPQRVTGQATTVYSPGGNAIPTQQLDDFLVHLMDSLQIPGTSIAILNNKELVYQRNLGVTDWEQQTPITATTSFEAASLSKPIFAYFMLMLAEQGKFDLDVPLYTYLDHPGFAEDAKPAYKEITGRMVLCHSAGMPNWSDNQPMSLAFPPGEGFSYSGEAYQWMAAAVGTHLDLGWGVPFDSLFRASVTLPLGMDHTSFIWSDYHAANKSKSHLGTQVQNRTFEPKNVGAGYSLHSSASEYALFIREMMVGQYLSPTWRQEMLTEQNPLPEDGPIAETGQTGWTLGFAMKPTEYGTRYLHTGNNPGFMSFTCFYPETGFGLVVFLNCDQIEPFYEGLGAFLDDPF